MSEHTTHFDDCGCKTAALRLRVAALEAALTHYANREYHSESTGDIFIQYTADEALSGEPTALREMLEQAAQLGAEAQYDCQVFHDADAHTIVERILKGGGK